jgi:methylenetetrahydrofolate reductase (NADPH)
MGADTKALTGNRRMHLASILKRHKPAVSFEFFPPDTDESARALVTGINVLQPLKPSFVTVTYGAGGETQARTREVVVEVNSTTDITVIPHLTCVGSSRSEIADIIGTYVDAGIENMLLLRGDAPKGQDKFEPVPDGFRFASELVAFARKEFPSLGIGVAGYPEGHPETPDKLQDVTHLKHKVDAGADVIITQLFFDNRDFFDFKERCTLEGINIPILAGIMPIRSIKGIRRMAGMCGARVPAPLLKALKRAGDDPTAVRRVGTHWATEQCRDLLDQDVAGIHLYTLNTSTATRRIYENLGVAHSDALRP